MLLQRHTEDGVVHTTTSARSAITPEAGGRTRQNRESDDEEDIIAERAAQPPPPRIEPAESIGPRHFLVSNADRSGRRRFLPARGDVSPGVLPSEEYSNRRAAVHPRPGGLRLAVERIAGRAHSA